MNSVDVGLRAPERAREPAHPPLQKAGHAMIRSKVLAGASVTAVVGVLAVMSTGDATAADPGKAPGGNFDLSVWQLQEPVGSPGSPTTIPSSRLQGANGYQDSYFYTDQRDG